MNNDRHNVEADEDVEVRPCRDRAVALTVLVDHLTQDVVKPGAEEAGSWCGQSELLGWKRKNGDSQIMRIEIWRENRDEL